jgi:hypothetical protein
MTVRVTSTVIAAAASYDLVALDDLKADLGIADSASDSFLARAISKASAAAAQYCNRMFVRETVQDVFDLSLARLQARGEAVLLARSCPVASVAGLVEGTVTLVRDTDYRVDLAAGQFYRLSNGADASWCATPVTLTYDAGFDEVPLDVQAAVTQMVNAMNFDRTRDPLLRSENILSGLYAYTLFDPGQVPAGTAEQVASTLDAYRVPVLG